MVAPLLGATLAAVVFRRTQGEITCAKLIHTDEYVCHFRHCAYRRAAAAAADSMLKGELAR